MRAVVQRVSRAVVHIDRQERGRIGPGLAVLVSVGPEDSPASCDRLATKVAKLRIFEDRDGKMNLGPGDVAAQLLVISQFTLHANTTRGNRPSFIGAAPPEHGEPLYQRFLEQLRGHGLAVVPGVFGARMLVEIANDGPVTLVLSTDPWETTI